MRVAGCKQWPHGAVLGGEHGLAKEVPPELVELVLGEAVEGGDETGLGGDASVDLGRREVVLQDDLGAVAPRRRCSRRRGRRRP